MMGVSYKYIEHNLRTTDLDRLPTEVTKLPGQTPPYCSRSTQTEPTETCRSGLLAAPRAGDGGLTRRTTGCISLSLNRQILKSHPLPKRVLKNRINLQINISLQVSKLRIIIYKIYECYGSFFFNLYTSAISYISKIWLDILLYFQN